MADGVGTAGATQASVRATYGRLGFDRFFIGNTETTNRSRFKLEVHLLTLQATLRLSSGTTFDLALPTGVLERSDLRGRSRSSAPGDLEVKARQSLRSLLPDGAPNFSVSAGLVSPTGPYASRAGSLDPDAIPEQYLSLGRGAFFALGELDAYFEPLGGFGLFSQGALRFPLTDAADGFRWGPEVRGVTGATLRLASSGPWSLSAVASTELLFRGESSSFDPFIEDRVPYVNGGGVWFTGSPGLSAALPVGISASVSVRVPLYQNVRGLQPVAGLGFFFSVGGSVGLGSERAAKGRLSPTGRVTVVDYWADWCEPCVRLNARLEEARDRLSDVAIVRVDASEWSAERLALEAGGAEGLPVIEVYREDGTLEARLVGSKAEQFEDAVNAAKGRKP